MMKDLFDIVVALMLIVPSEMIIFLFKRIQTDFPFMKIKDTVIIHGPKSITSVPR